MAPVNRKLKTNLKIATKTKKANKFKRAKKKLSQIVKNDSLEANAAKCESFIKNYSDKKLSNIKKIALGKGLKFVFTPNKPKRYEILNAFKAMSRTMRIRYLMWDKPKQPLTRFKLPSQWVPDPTYSQNLEDYLEATKTSLAKIPIHNVLKNTTKAEQCALNALKNDKSIILKPFDKGRGIAVMNRLDYKAEILRQLSNVHYEKLESDLTDQTKIDVLNKLQDMFLSNDIDKNTFSYLNPYNHPTRTPVIYVLPKVHKTPPENSKFSGRPIISGNGSPTEKISEFVDYFLLPIVQRQQTYVKDTNHIIELLEETKLPDNILLATMDVVSMYTNTPQDEAISVTCASYDSAENDLYDLKKIQTHHMRDLLHLILTRNCFEFDSEFYRQKIGCAMGSQASPEICDIVMHKLENRIIDSDKNILKWLRYRDDILIFYTGSKTEFDTLLNTKNQLHPTLKFTSDVSYSHVTYLDLTIFKGPRF